jgi:hypothetical protein
MPTKARGPILKNERNAAPARAMPRRNPLNTMTSHVCVAIFEIREKQQWGILYNSFNLSFLLRSDLVIRLSE